MQLRIEYRYDAASRNWSFRVPSLGIVGGAETRDEAEWAALEAIIYALEDDTAVTETTDGEVGYLD